VNTETETLVAVLRDRMQKMTDEERLALIDALAEGYCIHCGREETNGRRCQCWNDE